MQSLFQRFHLQLLRLQHRALGFELLHLVLHQAAKVVQFTFDDGILRLRSFFWLHCQSRLAAHRNARFLLGGILGIVRP